MNQVRLIGNLGKDPESITLSNGTLMVKFSLATSEKGKEGEPKVTQWHSIVCFDACAKKAVELLKKGSPIDLQGKINYRQFVTKDDVTKNITEIKMWDFQPVVYEKSSV
jgi:single-strand DNA-binding protein